MRRVPRALFTVPVTLPSAIFKVNVCSGFSDFQTPSKSAARDATDAKAVSATNRRARFTVAPEIENSTAIAIINDSTSGAECGLACGCLACDVDPFRAQLI